MGSVSIQDNLHVLSSDDVAHIHDAAANSTLDVTVIIDRMDSRDQLDQRTHAAIVRPTTIAIGLDPDHRYTRTNFGNGTGIQQREFASISTSGNLSFKDQHWGDGVVSIIQRAASSSRVAQAPIPGPMTPPAGPVPRYRAEVAQPPPAPSPASEHHIGFWGVMLWLAFATLVITAVWAIWFRKPKTIFLGNPPRGDDDNWPSQPSRPIPAGPPPVPPATYVGPSPLYSRPPTYVPPPAPVYYPPPAPVVVHGGNGNGDLALGMMIGENFGEARAERRHDYTPREPAPRAPTPAPAPPPEPRRSYDSYDAGGSSSSFGSPSYDAGGSSSSFDSGGGGCDVGGGGGCDTGGSGGDF